MTTCNHDYKNAIRKGRAQYECPLCGADISFAWFLWMEATLAERDSWLNQSANEHDTRIRTDERERIVEKVRKMKGYTKADYERDRLIDEVVEVILGAKK